MTLSTVAAADRCSPVPGAGCRGCRQGWRGRLRAWPRLSDLDAPVQHAHAAGELVRAGRQGRQADRGPPMRGEVSFHAGAREHDVDGAGGCNLFMPAGGSLNPPSHETIDRRMHYVHQDGPQVFKYAVRRMCEVSTMLLERNGFTSDDLALVVPNQANLRIIRAMQERLGIPDSKILINIDRYGNTTAGTIPLGLRDAIEQGRLHRGDLVLLMAVGAGFTTAGILLRWA